MSRIHRILFSFFFSIALIASTGCGQQSGGSNGARPSIPPPTGSQPGQSQPLVFSMSVGGGGATEVAPGATNFAIASFLDDTSGMTEDLGKRGLPLVFFASNGGSISHITGVQAFVEGGLPFNTGGNVMNPRLQSELLVFDDVSRQASGTQRVIVIAVGALSPAAPAGATYSVGIDTNALALMGAHGITSGREAFVKETTGPSVAPAVTVVGAPSGSNPAPGRLTVSTDLLSPAYKQDIGGGVDRIMVVPRLTATGEEVRLQQIGFTLTAGRPSSLTRVAVAVGNVLVGVGLFTNHHTTIPLSQDVRVATGALGGSVIVIADLAPIGPGKPGRSGELIQVDVDPTGTVAVGADSNQPVSVTGGTSSAGLRVYRAIPQIALVPLSQSGGADGNFVRFVVRGEGGAVGIGKLTFKVEAQGVIPGGFLLRTYSDPSFLQPVVAVHADGRTTLATQPLTGGRVTIYPENLSGARSATQAPSGGRYFSLDTTSISSGSGVISATLEGDAVVVPVDGMGTFATVEGIGPSRFIWSPNSNGTSGPTDQDHTNGTFVTGLPLEGLTQVRTVEGAPRHAP